MRRYFWNLLSAMAGRDPYGDELLEKTVQLAKTEECYKQLSALFDKLNGEKNSMQTLVENLRNRIREKDELIRKMREDTKNLKDF